VASPNSDSASGTPPNDDGTAEKWLVRILLGLAFGLAFGIEGMTLIRSYLIEDGPESPDTEETAPPALREDSPLVPEATAAIRVRRLRLFAEDDVWTFTLVAGPDSALSTSYTLSFDRLQTDGGTALTTAPSYTWAPGDTTGVTASWGLDPGQRPDALTITATTQVTPDSTVTTRRTVDVGHVPVRMTSN
jgi:hypothetical protein